MIKSREFKIGFFVVTICLVVFWGINFLKGKDIFSRKTDFYAVYNQVNGLASNSPVYVSGLKVGQVNDIYFLPDGSGNIIVKFSVNTNIKIPKNSTASIFNADIMGSKAIEINFSVNKQLAEDGDTLNSITQESIQEQVYVKLRPLVVKTENILQSVDTILTSLQKVLNNQTQDNLIKSFDGIRNTINNLEQATGLIDTLLIDNKSQISSILNNFNSISGNIKNNNTQLSNIIKNFSAISDSIAMSNFTNTINNANKTLADLSSIINKVKKGEGSAGLLLNNDSLYLNLQKSSDNLDLLIEDIREHPKRYIHFSVFGRKDSK
ncbi:MAG: hypothetical protein A2X12_07145 [Bacteroidetes bacterium GWE2_29_8]|nr:MAG: hypothetical protein A2X12_07145 [Bacteroidetes bacterium GWE2_29_8]OFY21715.1 MAG: hypothetical protein A2X02_04565 [Bacteroidetes bacterium GWF2_29_10]